MKIRQRALTFEDVLLIPKYSEVLPKEVDITSKLTRNIALKIPIVSAAMDTVTEHRAAIKMARLGGIGIIHKNMDIASQVREVQRVKKSESGIIHEPIHLKPYDTVQDALNLMAEYKISGFPVVNDDHELVGILTNRDLRFETDLNKRVEDAMTKAPLVTAPKGISLDDAEKILRSTIGVELDRKTMLIRIKVTTKDPKLSASIANRLIALLRDFNNTKSSKLAKSELQYLREKLKETKEELYLAENKLMEYEKRHIDYATTTDPVVIMEHDKLKRELELKENSFIDILKEIELKEIEIKRTSPVVNVLDYATTPTVKSAPRRKLIAIVGALLTTFVSMSYCILKEIPIQSLLQRFT